MRIKRAIATTGTALAGIGLVVGLTPQASAASHWTSGTVHYGHHRDVDIDLSYDPYMNWLRGETSVTVYWDNNYRASLSAYVYDRSADSLAVRGEVSYWYKSGSHWKWASRTYAQAAGNHDAFSHVHTRSGVKVKWIKIRLCTVNPGGVEVGCSSWK